MKDEIKMVNETQVSEQRRKTDLFERRLLSEEARLEEGWAASTNG